MNVYVQSVNFTADKKLIVFVEDKVGTMQKFHDKVIDCEVFLKVLQTSEKENKLCELKINIPGHELMVKKEAKSFEEAAVNSIDSMVRQLKKIKQKERELQY